MSTIPGTIFFSSDTFHFCSIFFFLNKLPYVLILMLTEIKFSNASILLDRFFHSFPPISVKPFSHYYASFSSLFLFPLQLFSLLLQFSFSFVLLSVFLFYSSSSSSPSAYAFFPSSSCKALFYFKSVYEYLYCE